MLEGKFEREEKIEKTWGGTISIDLFIDHGKKEVRIFDSYDKSNKIVISGGDWNNLVCMVRDEKIGLVGDYCNDAYSNINFSRPSSCSSSFVSSFL